MLRVSRQPNGQPEIFFSVQGECPATGNPSVFLRLATCNLACSWCDTKYTWDWSQHDYAKEVASLDTPEVEQRILSSECRSLVITGGKPLLQQSELAPLVVKLKAREFRFEVETNGTIVPMPEMARDTNGTYRPSWIARATPPASVKRSRRLRLLLSSPTPTSSSW